MPSLFINVPILNETYSSQHFIFPSRFNMTITFQTPLLDPHSNCHVYSYWFILSTLTLLTLPNRVQAFWQVSFSVTYFLHNRPLFAVLKTFMNIILFTKMLDQRFIFHNRKRVIFNQLSSKAMLFYFPAKLLQATI